jgi:hypothetical protein
MWRRGIGGELYIFRRFSNRQATDISVPTSRRPGPKARHPARRPYGGAVDWKQPVGCWTRRPGVLPVRLDPALVASSPVSAVPRRPLGVPLRPVFDPHTNPGLSCLGAALSQRYARGNTCRRVLAPRLSTRSNMLRTCFPAFRPPQFPSSTRPRECANYELSRDPAHESRRRCALVH